MEILFRSSFFILTTIALFAATCGAWMCSWLNVTEPPRDQLSLEYLMDAASWGLVAACMGLIPYWIFHGVRGDFTHSWSDTESKARRAIWVICWAGCLGWLLPTVLLPISYIT